MCYSNPNPNPNPDPNPNPNLLELALHVDAGGRRGVDHLGDGRADAAHAGLRRRAGGEHCRGRGLVRVRIRVRVGVRVGVGVGVRVSELA